MNEATLLDLGLLYSSCGDATAVSLSSGATGTNHTFLSVGIPGKGVVWPREDMSKYDGA